MIRFSECRVIWAYFNGLSVPFVLISHHDTSANWFGTELLVQQIIFAPRILHENCILNHNAFVNEALLNEASDTGGFLLLKYSLFLMFFSFITVKKGKKKSVVL